MSPMTNGSPPFPDLDTFVTDLRAALAFLTRVPVEWLGTDASVRPDFRRAAAVFPLAGCLVGILGGIVLVLAHSLGVPPLVCAALAVVATMMLTGGLHEDGLADVADSFGGSTSERRLEIMHDSRIGSYGAAALFSSLIIRVACLASLMAAGAVHAAIALVLAEGISRAALVRMWHELPAARPNGLAHDTGPPDHTAMVLALAMAGVLAILGIPVVGLRAAVLAAVLAAFATYIFTRVTAQAIGGRTGDTLGACQQVALVAWLVGAATL
jgi:adenosylcobinamide-GDP ribazoletransferase